MVTITIKVSVLLAIVNILLFVIVFFVGSLYGVHVVIKDIRRMADGEVHERRK